MRLLFPIIAVASLMGCDASLQVTPSLTSEPQTATNKPIPLPVDPATIQVTVGEPSQNNPVAIGAAIDRIEVAVNQQVQFVVRAKMADGWHIYAAEGPTGVGRPTKCILKLPEGITAGEWTFPTAEVKDSSQGPVGMYHGEASFSIPLTVTANAAAGSTQIECEFHHQPCTDQQCLRPTATKLIVPITITP